MNLNDFRFVIALEFSEQEYANNLQRHFNAEAIMSWLFSQQAVWMKRVVVLELPLSKEATGLLQNGRLFD